MLPNSVATSYRYDNRGRLVKAIVTAADGVQQREYQLSYDALGNVSTVTDPRGKVTSFSYDAQGNDGES